MGVLRHALIAASQSDALERQVKERTVTSRVAAQFIAGDDVDDGLAAARRLADGGKRVSLDYVGEYADDEDDARQAAKVYLEVLDRVGQEGLPAGISVKSTLLGRLLAPDLCEELLGEIAAAAARVGTHVSLDMEGTALTEDTIRLCETMRAAGHDNVGVAVQSYLHRTREDVVRLSRAGASVRLCKGAYDEPAYLAYRRAEDVDASFAECATYLLEHGTYPRIATHDADLMASVKAALGRLDVSRDAFEFQMLYGVRTDVQDALVRDGYRLCVYVPFGHNWYAYFMRRLAERPANTLFFARALLGA